MRLFVALVPPREVLTHLDGALAALRAAQPGLRFVPAERQHLTLAFLGEVPERRVPGLSRRLERVAGRSTALSLELHGCGCFGDRVLFTRIGGDVGPLKALATGVAAAARHSGLEIEDRAFRPHLTIARARDRVSLRPLARGFEKYAGPPWHVVELHLVRSRLGPHPTYEAVGRWPLGAG